MSNAQAAWDFDDGGPDLARLRDLDVDLTPRLVVRQGVERVAELLAELGITPQRILDPAAGHGVYGSEIRRVWPEAMLYGIEPRAECAEDLDRNGYDLVSIMTFERAIGAFLEAGTRFDVIATNPAFSRWSTHLALAESVVSSHGLVCFLGLSNWGQAQSATEGFRPWRQLRVTGRIAFRGPGLNPETGKPWGSDQRDVSHWVWRPAWDRDWWRAENLPTLPKEAREWNVPPGTEWRDA